MRIAAPSPSWRALCGLLAALFATVPAIAQTDSPPAQAPSPASAELTRVDHAYLKAQVVFPAKPDVTVIDTRAAAAGYDESHIPGALHIPDDQLANSLDQLPNDRRHTLIFYCEDAQCTSSGRAAASALRLGYANARVYEGGLADWKQHGGVLSVSVAYLQRLKKLRASHLLIDARPARTALRGMIPGAINIPDSEFDQHVGKLPASKESLLIFYCGGIDCPLSASSVEKARALGYRNARTFPEGYPEWLRLQTAPSPASR